MNKFRNLTYYGLLKHYAVNIGTDLIDAIIEVHDYAKRTNARFHFLTEDFRLLVVVEPDSDPSELYEECIVAVKWFEKIGRIIGPTRKNAYIPLCDPPKEFFTKKDTAHHPNTWMAVVGKNILQIFKEALEYAQNEHTLITFEIHGDVYVTVGPDSDIQALYKATSSNPLKGIPYGP